MINFDDFIDKYNGDQVEVAGSANAKYQCVDLANAYIREVLDLPIIEWTDAKDFPRNASDKYDYILNTPDNVPMKGDIMVWTGAVGGGHGHIAMFMEGDVNSFTSFDQNYSIAQRCTIEAHSYLYVDGWMRVKETANQTLQQEYDQCRKDRDNHWNDLQVYIKELGDLNTKYNLLLGEKDKLDKQLTESLNQMAELRNTTDKTIAAQNEQTNQLSAKSANLESQILSLTTLLNQTDDQKQKQINTLTMERDGLQKRVEELQTQCNKLSYELIFEIKSLKLGLVKFN